MTDRMPRETSVQSFCCSTGLALVSQNRGVFVCGICCYYSLNFRVVFKYTVINYVVLIEVRTIRPSFLHHK
jgi:hypothetical protein